MDYRIKDLPESDRPREKMAEKGVESLSDSELLEIVLRTGIEAKNARELASEILSKYTIGELADRKLEELENLDGVSTVKAGQLKAVSEISRRTKKQEKESLETFSDVRMMV